MIDDAPECLSCGEEIPGNECPKSKRPCGHHCNCSWVHDQCCWCGQLFGDLDPALDPSESHNRAPNAPL